MNTIERPELFFCLAAPIGTDLDQVTNALKSKLKNYEYDIEVIHITKLLPAVDKTFDQNFSGFYEKYSNLIASANGLREKFEDNSIMAKLALLMIGDCREKRNNNSKLKNKPVAYVIRQFKRVEEINLFREIYGKLVFQISAYAEPELRKNRLANKMRDEDRSSTRVEEFEADAIKLLARDENEAPAINGQRLRDIFSLADVFIDATNQQSIKNTIDRFVKLLFGYNGHSPTREEYGMYIAKSASLRSLDLSRQVGAAIFSKTGEIKTLGCNEVPSPSGGTYWEGDEGDGREFQIGRDTNEDFKYRLLSDTLIQLAKVDLIDEVFAKMDPREFVEHIKKDKKINLEKSLMMMDIIEYGRIIHAEMNAITDAARKGINIENSTLYCTTFPCHLCAKHIISSGINKVVYIEPYPKSYAKELYRDDIILKRSPSTDTGKIYFEAFIGISPFRYRDLFEKSKRKDSSGKYIEWHFGEPRPIIITTDMEYINKESEYLTQLLVKFSELGIALNENE